MSGIFYKSGYRYQLVEPYFIQTPIRPDKDIVSDWYSVMATGLLIAAKGYAWNGANGPTIDTKDSMSASLVHDVLCQCMKERKLDYVKWSPIVHQFFEERCRAAGMNGIRASIWHWGVRVGQGGNPDDPDTVVVQEAP